MKLVITKSTSKGKKYTAVFHEGSGTRKTIHFGSATSQTFVEGASQQKREAYLARHKVNKRFDNDPMTAHTLSKDILWGESKSITENIRNFKRKFNLE